MHRAEYVTTLDFSRGGGLLESDDAKWRITAANFLQLSPSQGMLLLRTNLHAFKWAVGLAAAGKGVGATPVFDVEGSLKRVSPLPAAVPRVDKAEGVGKRHEEAAAQLDERTIYYSGECKRLHRCAVAMVHDDHPYLPGDVDGNGRVDADDLEALQGVLAGAAGLYCRAAADVDGDGRISEADIEYLRRYLEGHGPAPVRSGSATGDLGLGCGYYNPAVAGGNSPAPLGAADISPPRRRSSGRAGHRPKG